MQNFLKEMKGILFIVVSFYCLNHLLFYSSLYSSSQYIVVSFMIALCILSIASPDFLDKINYQKWGYSLSMVSAYCLLKFGIMTALIMFNLVQV